MSKIAFDHVGQKYSMADMQKVAVAMAQVLDGTVFTHEPPGDVHDAWRGISDAFVPGHQSINIALSTFDTHDKLMIVCDKAIAELAEHYDNLPFELTPAPELEPVPGRDDLTKMRTIYWSLATNVFGPKNTDYGSAFADLGVTGVLVRMNDKVRRLATLRKADAKVKSESILDTLADLANYALIGLMMLEREEPLFNGTM